MPQDFTKPHSSDADELLQFLNDKKFWRKHVHNFMGSGFDGCPCSISTMRNHIKFLLSDEYVVVLDELILLSLKSDAREYLKQKNNFLDRLFGSPLKDKIEVDFLQKIYKSKDLREIINWINDVKKLDIKGQMSP